MLSGPPLTGTLPADQLLERFLSGTLPPAPLPGGSAAASPPGNASPADGRLESLDPNGDDWGGGFLVQMLLDAGSEPFEQALLRRYPAGWLTAGQ